LALARPDARVWAVDASTAALAVARENGQRLAPAVTFLEGNWFAPLAGLSFHLVVSNPPYVAAGDPHLDLNGLPFEPASALTDGGDGLACLRAIIANASPYLEPGGWLLLEHGYDQALACRELLAAAGFQSIGSWRDLGGIERVTGGRKPG
ncbi:MAG: peptide chain release factor N(5)-glutamine methyltransferase, partial [Betaproteobacteria bacterium]|nr:peptide chain release factor N(5)-glutamine methyltransferase [Betaproteobacteria bacterium]